MSTTTLTPDQNPYFAAAGSVAAPVRLATARLLQRNADGPHAEQRCVLLLTPGAVLVGRSNAMPRRAAVLGGLGAAVGAVAGMIAGLGDFSMAVGASFGTVVGMGLGGGLQAESPEIRAAARESLSIARERFGLSARDLYGLKSVQIIPRDEWTREPRLEGGRLWLETTSGDVTASVPRLQRKRLASLLSGSPAV